MTVSLFHPLRVLFQVSAGVACLVLWLGAASCRRHASPTPEDDKSATCDIDISIPAPKGASPAPMTDAWVDGNPVEGAALRVRVYGKNWSQYSPEDAEAIRQGKLRVGLDEEALWISRGKPEMWWDTKLDGKPCRAMIFAVKREADLADRVVYTCDGLIYRITELKPVMGCDALAVIAARVDDERKLFHSLPLQRQWDVLRGNLVYGRSEEEVELSWGDPDKKYDWFPRPGREVEVWRYNDASGQTGGLEIYMRNERTVGWKVLPVPEAPPADVVYQAPGEAPANDIARATVEQVVTGWLPFVMQNAGMAANYGVNNRVDNSINLSNQNTYIHSQSQINNSQSTTIINQTPSAQACIPLAQSGCASVGPRCCDTNFVLCDKGRCVRNAMARCATNAECPDRHQCLFDKRFNGTVCIMPNMVKR